MPDLPGILGALILISARIGGGMLSAPFFSGQAATARSRLFLTLGLTVALYPSLAPLVSVGVWDHPARLLSLVIQEATVGLMIGLMFSVLFAAVQMAGWVMGFEIGLAIVQSIDPFTQVETGILAVFWNLLALALFLSLNGHHLVIWTIHASYDLLPTGVLVMNPNALSHLIRAFGDLFPMAVQLAATVLVVMTLVNVVIGMIGKAAPQVQILLIGFPLKILAGMLAMGLAIYLLPSFVQSALRAAMGHCQTLLRLLQ